MKLIIIYGPPAVGKLTVGEALSKATGFKLLHNHLVSDLVLAIFDRNSSTAINLNAHIKKIILETAAKINQKGIIMTFLYDGNKKDQAEKWCDDCCKIMNKYKGEVFLVKLSCNIEILKLRVTNPSRLKTKKITSTEKLLQVIKNENSFGEISQNIAQSLHIDNGNISPDQAVRIIRSCFNI